MRPPTIPPLVFGDLQQWLCDNRVKIGRHTLDIAAVVAGAGVASNDTKQNSLVESDVSNPQQMIKKTVSFCTNIELKSTPPASIAKQSKDTSPTRALQTRVPKKQKTLSFLVDAKKDVGVEQTPKPKTAQKTHRMVPKEPIGTPRILLFQSNHKSTTNDNDGAFQDFKWWRTLQNNAVLYTDPLPQHKTARGACTAIFRERAIDQLTQMYLFKVLPGGAATGVGAICDKLKGREMKRIPAFLPTKVQFFGKSETEQQTARAQFSNLWFRVNFVNNMRHPNEIVHFKDLIKENTAEALKPLLSALFVHLSHGDEQIQRVMAFALDAVFA